MSIDPKRAPARAKKQRSQPAKSVKEPHRAGFISPVQPELEQTSMSPRTKRTDAGASLHPCALQFLRDNDLARTETLARQEVRQKLDAEFHLPLKALSDCTHRIPRRPQPSPDRLSPGADVSAWVRTLIVPAIAAVRKLEATLGHSVRSVFVAPLPSNGLEARRRHRQLMRELFVDLYEAEGSDTAVKASIATLEAIAAADDGEVGVLAEWFDIATAALGEKLVAIAAACDETGQTPSDVAATVWEHGCAQGAATSAEAAPPSPTTPSAVAPTKPVFAHDYSWVRVHGETYTFTTSLQRAVICALAESWKQSGCKDGCGLHIEVLREKAGSAASDFRVAKCFSGSSALHSVLRPGSRGYWALHLNDPRG